MIGIIGGAGPYATAYMHWKVVEAMQARGACQDQDFPAVVVCNVPGRATSVDGLVSGGEREALRHVTQVARALQDAGSTVLLPACNTFDLFRSDLQTAVKATVLSLPQLAAAHAASCGYRRVRVLCSNTARAADLHTQALAKHGVEAVRSTDDQQRDVNSLIAEVMAHGATGQGGRRLQRLCREGRRSADAVLIGCTELSVFDIHGEGLIDGARAGVAAAADYAFRPKERNTDAGVQRSGRH